MDYWLTLLLHSKKGLGSRPRMVCEFNIFNSKYQHFPYRNRLKTLVLFRGGHGSAHQLKVEQMFYLVV